MTHEDLQTLVDFHYWALDHTLVAVEGLTPDQFTRDVGSSFPSIRDTLAHLQGAEMIWLGRLRGRAPSAFPRPERFGSMVDVRAAWAETEADLRGGLFLLIGGERRGVTRSFVEQADQLIRIGYGRAQAPALGAAASAAIIGFEALRQRRAGGA